MAERTQDGEAAPSAVDQLPTDPAQLELEVARRRDKVAATVDELVYRAHPREIARRALHDVERRLREATTTPDGQLRTGRVVAVAAAVVAVLALAAHRRRSR